MDDWTATELATEAGVTRRWVNELCSLGADGPFPNARQRGRMWFIPHTEGAAWLDARQAQQAQSST